MRTKHAFGLATAMALAGVGLIGTAFAQARGSAEPPSALAGVYACADLQNEAERLACYDRAVQTLRGAETRGDVVALDKKGVATVQRDSFGFNIPSLDRIIPNLRRGDGASDPALNIDEVELQVERILPGGPGRVTFLMTNGQAWTQVLAESARHIKEGDTVRVRKASLGSFMLVGSRGAALRVKRER